MIRASVVVAAGLFVATMATAAPLEQVTYLLPAPERAIVFAPFLLAQQSGRYAAEGLSVRFRVVPGGLNVGAALGRGEGDLGGAIGDTPIQLRARGVGIRGVALLGHHGFVTLMTRGDLRPGPDVAAVFGVPSLADTTHYALKAWMRSVRMDPARATVRSSPTDTLVDDVAQRRMAGMVGTVDWGVRAERQGVALAYHPLDDVYPVMAQAIMAPDTVIRDRPETVRAFVRATLAGICAIERDPAASADAWRALVPDSGYSRAEVIRIFTLLSDQVYGRTEGLGRFDRRTMARAVVAAKQEGLIPATATGRGSFTNQFVGGSADRIGN